MPISQARAGVEKYAAVGSTSVRHTPYAKEATVATPSTTMTTRPVRAGEGSATPRVRRRASSTQIASTSGHTR